MDVGLSSQVELYDSDILKMDKGPVKWMTEQQGKSMDLENFRKAVIEKFAEIGFGVWVKTYDTTESGTYAFEIEIQRRLEQKAFDFEQMRWEVVQNLLDEPGVVKGETIKADAELARIERDRRFHGTKHKH